MDDLKTTVVDQPDELKAILEPVVSAAALSDQNAIVVGPPRCGKTEIFLYMGIQMFGKDHAMMVPCTPTTPESKLMGYESPIYQINPIEAEKNGVPRWTTYGTPVDENVSVCVLDEIPRLGDPGSDALVSTLHDISIFHKPLYLATANWWMPTPRTAALHERFVFTVLHNPSEVDISKLIRKKRISTWEFDLPTRDEIVQVREWLETYISSDVDIDDYKCTKEIDILLNTIQTLALQDQANFEISNGIVFAWRSILYAMGCWKAGANDFEELPRIAYDALSYAYPVTDIGMSLHWRSLIMSTVDVVETEIGEFKANAYAKWRMIRKKYERSNGKLPAEALDQLSKEMGKEWAKAERELQERFPDSSVVTGALREMASIYRQMIQGKEI